jgi:arylsulfatase B
VNLIPYLNGTNQGRPHETLYWRSGKRTALRMGDWKLLRNPKRKQPPTWELYNLAADLREMNNLAIANPQKLQQLQAAWKKLDNEMIAPVWTPRR